MFALCCYFEVLRAVVRHRFRSALLMLFSVVLLAGCSATPSVSKGSKETPRDQPVGELVDNPEVQTSASGNPEADNSAVSNGPGSSDLSDPKPTSDPKSKPDPRFSSDTKQASGSEKVVSPGEGQVEQKQPVSSDKAQKNNDSFGIETMRRGLATGVFETAKWIDSFFADPEYPNENVDVELEIRQFFIKSESKDIDIKTRASGRVRLPNAERSVSLTFDGNDEQESEQGNTSISDSVRSADDQPSLGLEYLEEKSPGYNQRVKLGYRFGEDSFYLGGRLRKAVAVGDKWLFRASQRVRWYHQFGWENRTIIDFESLLPQNRFFQQRFLVAWREDERDELGAQVNFQSAYIYPLSDTTAWRFIWSSNYHTQPQPRWVSTQLAWGYRMQLPKEWIYVEIRPFVEWEELFHWQGNLGLHLSFDLIIQK